MEISDGGNVAEAQQMQYHREFTDVRVVYASGEKRERVRERGEGASCVWLGF